MNAKADNGWLKKGYWGFAVGANFLGHFLLLIIRLYWGALLVLSGLGKYMHIQGVADFFAKADIPYPLFMAYLAGAIEFFGGLFLILGLFSRWFAFLLSILLIVALLTAHHEATAQIFTKPSLLTKEEPFLFLYTSLVVFCFGPGLFSVDYWLEKRAYGKAL